MNQIVNQTQMQELASSIALKAKVGDVFGLSGTLGSGKSFFSKHFINALTTKKTEVLSPTFNIVYSYETPAGTVHHFDLYRIKDFEELENIGFFDYIKSGICLIEWPEVAEKFLKKSLGKNYTEIKIEIRNEAERIVNVDRPL